MATQLKSKVNYVDTIGFGADVGGRGFHIPVDLSIRPDGRIFVVNRSPAHRKGIRVGICDINHGWYHEFGSYGNGDGQFKGPTAITHGPDDRVYLADEELNRITVYDPNGEFISKWGEKGSNPGQISGPSGLKFMSNGDLLVVDHLNNRIQRMTADGGYISHFGTPGRCEGEFNLPWGIDIDSNDNIYVADWQNDRIQRFSPDGVFIDAHGSSGTGDQQFNRPSDVAVDQDGFIYVADWLNQRVQLFDGSWDFIKSLRGEATVSPWAQDYLNANADEAEARTRFNPLVEVDQGDPHEVSSKVESYLWDPTAIEIDPEGRLIITDSLRHRLQVYQRSNE
jgi:DNA-binding beta-propeller fold protein YncE